MNRDFSLLHFSYLRNYVERDIFNISFYIICFLIYVVSLMRVLKSGLLYMGVFFIAFIMHVRWVLLLLLLLSFDFSPFSIQFFCWLLFSWVHESAFVPFLPCFAFMPKVIQKLTDFPLLFSFSLKVTPHSHWSYFTNSAASTILPSSLVYKVHFLLIFLKKIKLSSYLVIWVYY